MQIRQAVSEDIGGLERLFVAVRRDGGEHLSEYKAQRLLAAEGVREAVAIDQSRITCYVQAAWHRPVSRRGAGHWALEIASTAEAAVVAEVVRFVTERIDDRWVLWSRRPTDSEVASALALRETRALHRLAMDLPAVERPHFPAAIRIAGFRVGVDESPWLEANNAAFAGHPENGALDTSDLARRRAEPWFDAAGIRMAWRGGRLVGSCWTKVHPSGEGEIYIIGVVPAAQDEGLGRALVLEGLRYLHEVRQAPRSSLWVERANTKAVALYRRMGFRTETTVRQFEP